MGIAGTKGYSRAEARENVQGDKGAQRIAHKEECKQPTQALPSISTRDLDRVFFSSVCRLQVSFYISMLRLAAG